jgi:DNA-binding transcriptional regulator YiaG
MKHFNLLLEETEEGRKFLADKHKLLNNFDKERAGLLLRNMVDAFELFRKIRQAKSEIEEAESYTQDDLDYILDCTRQAIELFRKSSTEGIFGEPSEMTNDEIISAKELEQRERRIAVQLLESGSFIGGDFKYARKALGLTISELAGILDVDVAELQGLESEELRIENIESIRSGLIYLLRGR